MEFPLQGNESKVRCNLSPCTIFISSEMVQEASISHAVPSYCMSPGTRLYGHVPQPPILAAAWLTLQGTQAK